MIEDRAPELEPGSLRSTAKERLIAGVDDKRVCFRTLDDCKRHIRRGSATLQLRGPVLEFGRPRNPAEHIAIRTRQPATCRGVLPGSVLRRSEETGRELLGAESRLQLFEPAGSLGAGRSATEQAPVI